MSYPMSFVVYIKLAYVMILAPSSIFNRVGFELVVKAFLSSF